MNKITNRQAVCDVLLKAADRKKIWLSCVRIPADQRL